MKQILLLLVFAVTVQAQQVWNFAISGQQNDLLTPDNGLNLWFTAYIPEGSIVERDYAIHAVPSDGSWLLTFQQSNWTEDGVDYNFFDPVTISDTGSFSSLALNPTVSSVFFSNIMADQAVTSVSLDITTDHSGDLYYSSIPAMLDNLNYNFSLAADEYGQLQDVNAGVQDLGPPTVPEPSTNAFFFIGTNALASDPNSIWQACVSPFRLACAFVVGAIGVLCVVFWVRKAVIGDSGQDFRGERGEYLRKKYMK